ncbi:MAG TPA: 4-(cytidine 5'-diphospho)-2-C-methyl-D-erythritol kinase [Abditibacteriaceae bacterium]|jgi:4-diphosphocytidyl-2-C-methyl-D-erythritol kinase
MIHVRAACKINLSLDVLALRSDGYHELSSIVHTVGLWDELQIVAGQNGFKSNVDLPDDNLCTRAATRWFEALGEGAAFSTVHISLQKHLPIGAGIGGGSGNAAAVLLALNALQAEHSADGIDDEKLHRIAAKLGADVPLFLRGGCQLMEGIGEKLSPLPPQDFWIVLLKPPVFGDTRAVFRQWDEVQPASLRATPTLTSAIRSRDIEKIAASVGNDLTDAAKQSGQPVEATLQYLRGSGAIGASLSGSGAACFGIFEDKTAARAALAQLQASLDAEWFVAAAPLCARGVEIV